MRVVKGMCVAAVAVAAAGCAVGKPLGFNDQETWAFPVMNGLEDSLLVTPVKLNGKGPYLFHVAPRAATMIDPRLVKELDLYLTRTDMKVVDDSDRVAQEQLDFVDVERMELGDLVVRGRKLIVMPRPSEAVYHGQPVLGILGKDVFAESLIWTFDRDRQMVYLATQGHATPPADAVEVKAESIRYGQFYVQAMAGERPLYVYVDLFLPQSTLWPAAAERAGLQRGAHTHIDAFGRRSHYDDGWKAERVTLGGLDLGPVVFVPHTDARDRQTDHDGQLGRSALAAFRVTFNWHEKKMWLTRRAADLEAHADERVLRWGGDFAGCQARACATATIERENPRVVIAREPRVRSVGYELLLQAVDQAGKPLPLPKLVVAFPPGSDTAELTGSEAAMFSAASRLRVLDMTPFVPPQCQAGGPGCIWLE